MTAASLRQASALARYESLLFTQGANFFDCDNCPPCKCHARPFVPDFVMELGSQLWNADLHRVVFGIKRSAQPVEAPMHASECRSYAEQCLQLARTTRLAPEHRQALLAMADEWRKIAEALDAKEGLFSHKRMDA